MDFAFTEEEELFRNTVRQFAKRELRPNYAAHERPDFDERELLAKMASMGLLGLRLPVEYGGADASAVMVGIAAEECARGDFSAGGACLGTFIPEMLVRFGSKQLQSEWLPEVSAGRRTIAVALTEPHCGADASALITKAVKDGDDYVLSGEKTSISGPNAEGCVLFARIGDTTGARGVTAFFVPMNTPCVSVTFFNDLGCRPARRGSIFLDDVRIPRQNLLGEEGRGFHMIMNQFDYSRVGIALQCIGAALQTVEETIVYVKTRTTFGRPLARYQGVAFPIVEAYSELEAVRLLCYKALWLRDHGLPHTKEAAMVKWMGPKLAAETIHQMLLLHGHAGYGSDYPIEQRLRDVIGMEIGDGTAEIMKIIVAGELFGREFRPN